MLEQKHAVERAPCGKQFIFIFRIDQRFEQRIDRFVFNACEIVAAFYISL